MPYVITEACITSRTKRAWTSVPWIASTRTRTAVHQAGRVHRLRRLRARVPGDGDIPRRGRPRSLKSYIALNKDVFDGPNPPGRPTRKSQSATVTNDASDIDSSRSNA